MQDEPAPTEILASVAAFLRDTVVPEATPHTAFKARVAANALDLVARQIALAPPSDAAEQVRLTALLGHDGALADLNRQLAVGIADGSIDPATPGLRDHLLATTLAKLAVDQPSYSGYRAALDAAQPRTTDVDFALPADLVAYLAELDRFIETEIAPLQARDDNQRFFDHRREHARTDWDNDGLPRPEWEALLAEARRLADAAGHFRFAWPADLGGKGGSQLWMAVIREHLAAKGLGLHNDLQNEHSIVGNNPFVLMFKEFATPEQVARDGAMVQSGEIKTAFGLTEPNHGSDATFMETRGVRQDRDGRPGWLINGEKMWTTGMHVATHVMTFARTSGGDGDPRGITCFIVPADTPGVKIEEWLWTFNMPTDHPRVSFTDVWVPEHSYWGEIDRGLGLGQSFVHQNRIRQAASSLGAAVYCIEESVKYARTRTPFGKPLSDNQGIQFPLVELATQAEMLRLLIRQTAWQMDQMDHKAVERELSDKVSMCNYWANRLVCEAADRAMQVHGGIGYSRHKPFEHIYRHHRRYRITEGAEEIQMRKVAAFLFGYMGPRKGMIGAPDTAGGTVTTPAE